MKRLALAHLPTPLVRAERLGAELGIDLYVKRDDATGGAEAGNKIRKLEFLFAEALARGADTVITCGGIQSNHARATALTAAALGLRCVLFLRTLDAAADGARMDGNVLLDRLAGAEIQLITPAEYRDRARVMREEAERRRGLGSNVYVIPEGGSNGLGSLGYVEAMREVREQLDGRGEKTFDRVVLACGSGGTAAGVAIGAAKYGVARVVHAFAVCDDEAYFRATIARIVDEARALDPSLPAPKELVVDDSAKGPAYAVSTPEQRRAMALATRSSGLVFDPVYTGKAFFGASRLARSGVIRGERVLFLHTGGLPGLLAQGEELRDCLPVG